MKKILKITEWTLFVALLAIIFVSISSFLPTKKIISSYVVASGSMEPSLMTGSLVFTNYVEPKTLRAGDVITFTEPGKPKNMIVHRIERVIQGTDLLFRTKGDNNKAADGWTVTTNDIKGKMLFAIPYVGYGVSWLKTPIGFMIAVGIPALLLLVLQIIKIKHGIQEEVEKRVKKHLANQSITNSGIILLILFMSCLSFIPLGKTYAYFTTTATLDGINLVFVSISPTVTPTITPTITPTVTPTLTPTITITPTPTGECNIIISGTGAGSINTIECTTNNSTTVNRSNNSSTTTTVNTNTNTGENTNSNNTNSATTTVETTTTGNTNTTTIE